MPTQMTQPNFRDVTSLRTSSLGAFGGRDRRIPLLISPGSQSSPENCSQVMLQAVTALNVNGIGQTKSKVESSLEAFEAGDGRNISFCSSTVPRAPQRNCTQLLAVKTLNASGNFY